MKQVVIDVEKVSKKYLLPNQRGKAGYQTLRESLSQRFGSYLRSSESSRPRSAFEFWALKDVSFQLKQGDRLGILGRNGAGKSTLLKLISRITEPTEGRIRLKGRVASLLEVGAGFHPELTGGENIFLSGAVLGMRKSEIANRFEEIVEFSGIRKFLDTPAKFYSSGMYMRLAFSVAAHLEAEIVLVDEVLAVGDMDFQRKCLGKMKDVADSGRTIIFVSHNLAAVSTLCPQSLLLSEGSIEMFDRTSEVIAQYCSRRKKVNQVVDKAERVTSVADRSVKFVEATILNSSGAEALEVRIDEAAILRLIFEVLVSIEGALIPNCRLHSSTGICVFVSACPKSSRLKPGKYQADCVIPANYLNNDSYFIDWAVTSIDQGVKIHFLESSVSVLNVREPIERVSTRIDGYGGPMPGVVRPLLEWQVAKVD